MNNTTATESLRALISEHEVSVITKEGDVWLSPEQRSLLVKVIKAVEEIAVPDHIGIYAEIARKALRS